MSTIEQYLTAVEATRLLAEEALPNPGVGVFDRALDQAVLHDIPALTSALRAVLKVARDGDHADTCGEMLNKVYPCTCWKVDLTAAAGLLRTDTLINNLPKEGTP